MAKLQSISHVGCLMTKTRVFLLFALILFFTWNLPMVGTQDSIGSMPPDSPNDTSLQEPLESQTNLVPKKQGYNDFSIADLGSSSGVIDPLFVEQAGYIQSENLSARTDTGVNTSYSLSIDEANDWIGSVAEVDVWDLKKLYVVNGTFDEGIPGSNENPGAGPGTKYPYGWSAISYSTDSDQTQFAEYSNQGQTFVSVENQGEDRTGANYRHYAGTYVAWYQQIVNRPYTTAFVFNLEYLYYRGPIDKPGGNAVTGDIVMFVQVGATVVWSESLLDVSSRGTWYSTGDIFVSIPTIGSTFNFYLGIYVTEQMTLNAGYDYDNDGAADGIANTASISIQFDKISLTGQTIPDFDLVDLKFVADGTSVPITGSSGVGNASVTNPSLWTSGPVPISITSNDTVSFKYQTRLLSHRFRNSSYTTDVASDGVQFSISPNLSPHLELFTYIGTVDPYEEFVVNIIFPSDWENTTVLDPFQNDVTLQCSVEQSRLTIPTSLVSRLGWWQVSFDAPNYVSTLDTQVYSASIGDWVNETQFRTGNRTRVSATIGTPTAVPLLHDGVQVSWIRPNGSIWSNLTVSDGVSGQIYSAGRTFGSTNTSAGQWQVAIFWTNGTEIAYGATSFSLIHRSELTMVKAYLDATVGDLISNFVIYSDADNGEYILDDIAVITANWTSSTVVFTPELFRNWYEADFDTALIGGGIFLVNVDASRDYYDDASTSFTVTAQYVTSLEILNIGELPIERGLEESFPVHFRYERSGGSGIAGASVDVSYKSTFLGLERGSLQDYENGTYTIYLRANTSDTYSVTISVSKPYHEKSEDSFALIIGEIGTEINRLNGTSDAIKFGETYRLVFQYRNSTGFGLAGATPEIVSITPALGLLNSSFGELSGGFYDVLLIPENADVFTIVIKISLSNHETQFTTFTLTVSEIPSALSTQQSVFSVAFDQTCVVKLRLVDDELNGLPNAIIDIVNLPSGLNYTTFTDWLNGTYTIILTPLDVGSYDLLFRSYLSNYQNATEAISLLVTVIPTELTFDDNLILDYSQSYELLVFFNRIDLSLPISDVNITITGYPPEFMTYYITPKSGYYIITITGLRIDRYLLTVIASKTGYRYAEKFLTLGVIEIDTSIEGFNPAGSLTFKRPFFLNFSYLIDSNQTSIAGASLSFFGEASDWIILSGYSDGVYILELTPLGVGSHEITLIFSRYGFESRTFRLTFSVNRAPLEVVFVSGLSGIEESDIPIVILLLESSTGVPVSGAFVRYLLFDSSGNTGEFVTMVESDQELGRYSAIIRMPPTGDVYSVRIYVELDNYELVDDGVAQVTPTTNFTLLIVRTVRDNLLLFFGLGVAVVGLVTWQISKRRRVQENIRALAVKRLFDDAKNILGVIVLHKQSGLPLYSKILRGGVDESIVAAFITAIRSFRMEFDIENGKDEDKIVPISDIIRVVATKNLVCAFITLGSPSRQQRQKMIIFAQKVGMIFDHLYESTPMEVTDESTRSALDNLFDEILDGALNRNYTFAAGEKLPRSTDCIATGVSKLPGRVFRLETLATAIAGCGIEEGRAYQMIKDAIEQKILIVAAKDEVTPEEQFVAEVEALLTSKYSEEPEEDSDSSSDI